jgi:hypothetical protein
MELDMKCACGSVYGQTVNIKDSGKAEWRCRDCGKVQPWVESERPAWIEAAALECANSRALERVSVEQHQFADIIEKHWRGAQ